MGKLDTDDIICIEETTVTVRSYRHRTTVPSKIFRLLDIRQGDSLRWIALKDGTVFIRKVPERGTAQEPRHQ
jgi:bifunctional DNA-binding transcriptional regulator/antitoxin component of YhaV-PrlF toxin-antitoxin module